MNFKLGVLFIEEEGSIIAYSPALDLYTQGENLEEAKKMFEDAADLFFDEIIESGTYHDVLLDLGWKVSESDPEGLVPPEIVGQYQQKFSIPIKR